MTYYRFNYNKLRGRIRETGLTQEEVAKQINVNPATLSLKLNNASEFTQSEIRSICDLLDISGRDLSDYFFTCLV
ncbi:MAG: DUF739 family protein [Acutalibacteraceae bacterium]|nr:DUF739 family protein [Acutalibacteraceae bacterium]